jgi:hypothetical protein
MTASLDNGPPTPDGIPLKDWIAAAPIGRTAAYALLRALDLTPSTATFPGYPKAVPYLDQQQRVAMDAAALQVKNGRSVASIAAEVAGAPRQTLAGAVAEVQGEQGEARLAASAQALADARAGMQAMDPGPGGLAALVAAIAQATAPQRLAPEPDPLRVAERLHRAAELGAWLSTGELAEVLGVHRTAPDPVAWPERFPRPGYRCEAVKHGRGWFWRVSIDGTAPAPARALAASDRPVGFAAVLEASAVTLERRASMIGGPQLPPIPRPWG